MGTGLLVCLTPTWRSIREAWSDVLVDLQTVQRYSEDAARYAERYDAVPSPVARFFHVAFVPGSRVLELGAGSGRDLVALLAEGYEAYGVEPAQGLREFAVARRPELTGRVFPGALPEWLPNPVEMGGPFDGVLCIAVLQHLPRAMLFDAVYAIRSLLRAHGRALIAIPAGGDGSAETRDEEGRLFNGITPEELSLLFERIGFRCIGRWDTQDALGRSERLWATLLLELATTGSTRPLDLVEAVLSRREKKVATYKLALLRALCDIALTQPHGVTWRADARVAVPIEAIAKRWILYYWPLFASERFLPQMNGEWPKQRHALGFARELEALIAAFQQAGGLTAFAVLQRQGALAPNEEKLYRALLSRLRHVIHAGPVTYAGGSLAEGRLFAYEPGQVMVAADLWRELSLTGHWIQQALLLRWAELVSELSRGEVPPEVVVGRLLVSPDVDRETADARLVFDAMAELRCVWTERPIQRSGYQVDHVIPYALWHNNDLWNLLPASTSANRAKSDKLPTRELMRKRRPLVLDYWSASREAFPHRFAAEARAQLGAAEPSLDHLFDFLLEAVEVTALQRGCERWAP